MNHHPASAVDPDPDRLGHLAVEVRPATRVARWAWDLVDSRDGSVFESEFDFESPTAARRAALARLAELTASPRTSSSGNHETIHRLLDRLSQDREGIEAREWWVVCSCHGRPAQRQKSA